eukprot:jgi/Chlat1/2032/Chrsp159S02329
MNPFARAEATGRGNTNPRGSFSTSTREQPTSPRETPASAAEHMVFDRSFTGINDMLPPQSQDVLSQDALAMTANPPTFNYGHSPGLPGFGLWSAIGMATPIWDATPGTICISPPNPTVRWS